MANQKGFTLIELVVVIVILGVLAAVAVPKFIDLRDEAKVASAKGVFGACQAAAALNHAAKLAGKTTTNITTGTSLVAAMEGLPDGWQVDDAGANLGICSDEQGTAGDCASAEFEINITTVETGTVKAVLAKAGTATW